LNKIRIATSLQAVALVLWMKPNMCKHLTVHLFYEGGLGVLKGLSELWAQWNVQEHNWQLQICTPICSWMWPWNGKIECHLWWCFPLCFYSSFYWSMARALEEGEKISKFLFCILSSLISHALSVLLSSLCSSFQQTQGKTCNCKLPLCAQLHTICYDHNNLMVVHWSMLVL
jgi:hypothetical protein